MPSWGSAGSRRSVPADRADNTRIARNQGFASCIFPRTFGLRLARKEANIETGLWHCADSGNDWRRSTNARSLGLRRGCLCAKSGSASMPRSGMAKRKECDSHQSGKNDGPVETDQPREVPLPISSPDRRRVNARKTTPHVSPAECRTVGRAACPWCPFRLEPDTGLTGV